MPNNDILLMTDFFYPFPSANGVCMEEIAKEFLFKGYKVHVLCFDLNNKIESEIVNNIYIHKVRPRVFFRLKKFFEQKKEKNFLDKIFIKLIYLSHKLKKIMFFPLYPLTSPIVVYRYYKKALKIKNQYNIKIVVGEYVPLEAAITSALLKKKFTDIKSILYVVDSFSNCTTAKKYKIIEFLNWKWEQRLYNNVDKVLNMKCHEKHHRLARYNFYKKKLEIVDIPLFNLKNYKEINRVTDKIKIIYTGSLNGKDRNPEKFCDIMEEFSNIEINFYGNKLINLEKKKYKNTNFYGKVTREKCLEEVNNANIFLNFGNKEADMVPSKLFEYISTGKCIIHLYYDEEDSCLEYLKKYGNAYLIKYNETELRNKLYELFSNEKNLEKNLKVVNKDILIQNFQKNLSSYTVKRILS